MRVRVSSVISILLFAWFSRYDRPRARNSSVVDDVGWVVTDDENGAARATDGAAGASRAWTSVIRSWSFTATGGRVTGGGAGR